MRIRPERSDRGCPGSLPTGFSRRAALQTASAGFGWLALRGLFNETALGATPPADRPRPKARSVIFCFMDGGVSHVDTFDYKPELLRQEGKPIGDSAVTKKSQSSANRVWLSSQWEFRQRGQSGLWVSDLLPQIAGRADDLCVVRNMEGIQPLHGQQNLLLHTGRVVGNAPSFGSWVSYGLGSLNDNLPGYILLNNDWVPNGGFENFASAFLPATHQATVLRAKGTAVDNIVPQEPLALQRRKLELLQLQDSAFAEQVPAEAETIEAAIRNYETAFRMQTAVPQLADVSGETMATRRLYGLDQDNEYQRYYALQCLRARRLVEAGVRFIEITCPLTHSNNSPWDQHGNLKKYHAENALITDQAVAALIFDLKQRGLLDETIVLWAGEMGRTPHTPQISPTCGRDHHVAGYSLFMAGGGLKGGIAFGQTDDFGNQVVGAPATVHDIHATILHQLGLDHEQLAFRFGGRDVTLTDVHGHVLQDLIA